MFIYVCTICGNVLGTLQQVLSVPTTRHSIQLTMARHMRRRSISKRKPSNKFKSSEYVLRKPSYYAETYNALQSFSKDNIYCDIKLKPENGESIFVHKKVLASASPYFRAMFYTNFAEKNQDIIVIREMNPTAFKLLINFIYSGIITVDENNVKVLLPAADLLLLHEVKSACSTFLHTQLCLVNCIDIHQLADLYGCTDLTRRSELFLQQHFSHLVELDGFSSISSEQMVKLIASEKLMVLSEAKVFESVILWVKHDLLSRKCILPQLMEHIRLPLTSKDYILKIVTEEPLIINCLKCKDYVNEALNFHLTRSDELVEIPNNIRTKPRQRSGSRKVILVVGGFESRYTTELYDREKNNWLLTPNMVIQCYNGSLAVVNDNFVFYVGGSKYLSKQSLPDLSVLDLTAESPCWKLSVNMRVGRQNLGVGVINNHIYAVGGRNGTISLSSVEAFDCSTQKWRMISSMSTRRASVGVGVLNNLLYAVGGHNSNGALNSVECYHPCRDIWTPIAKLSISRQGVGVGVLNDVLYAVGGNNGIIFFNSVEAYRPSTGVWTSIPNMHMRRSNPGVTVLDGLLYVVGGYFGTQSLYSAEFYNPNTNTWTMVIEPMNIANRSTTAVTVDKP